MIDNIHLADLQTFVRVVQLGNFTRAADTLNVSRSHVSRQISKLENDLGLTLFIRTTRTLKLTQSAELLFQRCEQAFQNIDNALNDSINTLNEMTGSIRINCVGGYLGEELMASAITEFAQKYPNIVIELEFSSHRIDLITDNFDLGFRMGELEDAGFIAQKLFDVEMNTLASPAYLKKSPKKLNSPYDLQHHRCLIGSVKKWQFIENKTHKFISVPILGQIICKNGRVLVQGALSDNGIIRVPYLYCQEEIKSGKLVEVFQNWRIPSVPFSMIYHKDQYQPARLKNLIFFLKTRFNSALNK